MSNWIDYDLEVLADSPDQINRIADRLQRPSPELTQGVSNRWNETVEEVARHLTELVAFKWVKDLGPVDPHGNRAQMFRNTFKSYSTGIVRSHLHEVSEEFPSATFLLLYYDMQASYAGKEVFRAGGIVQRVHDGYQKAHPRLGSSGHFRSVSRRVRTRTSVWRAMVGMGFRRRFSGGRTEGGGSAASRKTGVQFQPARGGVHRGLAWAYNRS